MRKGLVAAQAVVTVLIALVMMSIAPRKFDAAVFLLALIAYKRIGQWMTDIGHARAVAAIRTEAQLRFIRNVLPEPSEALFLSVAHPRFRELAREGVGHFDYVLVELDKLASVNRFSFWARCAVEAFLILLLVLVLMRDF